MRIFRAITLFLLTCLAVFVAVPALAENLHSNEIGFELQAYPTGVIPGIRFERRTGNRTAAHLRLGYQEIRHQGFGVHEDERGSGFGFSLGYSWFLKKNLTGLALSLRSDLWFNTLSWEDNIGLRNKDSGTTDVTVLQPTLEISFKQPLSRNYILTPSMAYGREINIVTDGAPVGQGFIVLLGLTIGRTF